MAKQKLLSKFELFDVIMLEEVEDPVVASDGKIYSRESAERIMKENHGESPLTRELLRPAFYKNKLANEIAFKLAPVAEHHAEVLADILEKKDEVQSDLPRSSKTKIEIMRYLGLVCPSKDVILSNPYIGADGITRDVTAYEPTLRFDHRYNDDDGELRLSQWHMSPLKEFVRHNCRKNDLNELDEVFTRFVNEKTPRSYEGEDDGYGDRVVILSIGQAKRELAKLLHSGLGRYENHMVKATVALFEELPLDRLQMFAGIIEHYMNRPGQELAGAIRTGDLNLIIEYILKDQEIRDFKSFVDSSGNNILHLPCQIDRIVPFKYKMDVDSMIRTMLDRVGNEAAELLTMPNSEDMTPLHFAIRFCTPETLRLLMERLSPEQAAQVLLAEVGSFNQNGLHIAIVDRTPEVVEIVMEALGDKLAQAVMKKNNAKQNAIDLARKHHSDELAGKLVQGMDGDLGEIDQTAVHDKIREAVTAMFEVISQIASGRHDAFVSVHGIGNAYQKARDLLAKDLRVRVDAYVEAEDFSHVATKQLVDDLQQRIQPTRKYDGAQYDSAGRTLHFPHYLGSPAARELGKALNGLDNIGFIPLAVANPILKQNLLALDIATDSVLNHVRKPWRNRFHTGAGQGAMKAAEKMALKIRQLTSDFIQHNDFSDAAKQQFSKDVKKATNQGLASLAQHRGGFVALNVLVGLTGVGALIIAVHALATYIKDGYARGFGKTRSAKQAEVIKKAVEYLAENNPNAKDSLNLGDNVQLGARLEALV